VTKIAGITVENEIDASKVYVMVRNESVPS
jgi:hypothetical protein